MDPPQTLEEEFAEAHTVPHYIFGFIALLGIIILFCLVRTIYHFYKLRTEVNPQTNQSNVEIHSTSNAAQASSRQEADNNSASDSHKLRLQLDKLRRLLNRLNAMGTFSRDTIGDLSAQSVPYVNNSTVASSDLSNFWSSIDFDDFEESTIDESNFRNTPDKSVSLSVSDISQDTDEMHFSNARLNNKAISIASAFTYQTSASDAIAQILAILNAMPLKSRDDTQRINNDLKKIKRNSDESMTNKCFPSSSRSRFYSVETSTSHNCTASSSLEFIDNKLSSPCGSNNSDTLICTPEIKESGNSSVEKKLTDDTLRSKTKLLEQKSRVMHSKRILYPLDPAESKTSWKSSVEKKLICYTESKNRYAKNLSTSKSLDSDKFMNSTSVCCSTNPIKFSLSQTPKHSESSTALKRAISYELHLKQNENSRKMSEVNVTKITFFSCDKVAENRTQSYSNLSDKKLSLISSIKPCSVESHSYSKQSGSNLKLENSSHIEITISEMPQTSKSYTSQNGEIINRESEISKTEILPITSKNICSVSSKSLNLPLSSDTETLKSSVSECEIKQTQYLGMLSPNLSSISSETFLTPAAENCSPIKNRDWKSPVEPTSSISLPNNFTPCIENTVISRNSCIWFTPPSATEN